MFEQSLNFIKSLLGIETIIKSQKLIMVCLNFIKSLLGIETNDFTGLQAPLGQFKLYKIPFRD